MMDLWGGNLFLEECDLKLEMDPANKLDRPLSQVNILGRPLPASCYLGFARSVHREIKFGP